jgi:hypothetical protein
MVYFHYCILQISKPYFVVVSQIGKEHNDVAGLHQDLNKLQKLQLYRQSDDVLRKKDPEAFKDINEGISDEELAQGKRSDGWKTKVLVNVGMGEISPKTMSAMLRVSVLPEKLFQLVVNVHQAHYNNQQHAYDLKQKVSVCCCCGCFLD